MNPRLTTNSAKMKTRSAIHDIFFIFFSLSQENDCTNTKIERTVKLRTSTFMGIHWQAGQNPLNVPLIIALISFKEPPCWFNRVTTRCFICKSKNKNIVLTSSNTVSYYIATMRAFRSKRRI